MSRFFGILVLAAVAYAQQQQQQPSANQAQSVQNFVGSLINQVGFKGPSNGAQPAFVPQVPNGQFQNVPGVNFNQQQQQAQAPNFQSFIPQGFRQFFPQQNQPQPEQPSTTPEPTQPQLPVQCILSSSFGAMSMFACQGKETKGWAWEMSQKQCVEKTYCPNQFANNLQFMQGFASQADCLQQCDLSITTVPGTTVAGQTTVAPTTVVPSFIPGVPAGLFQGFNFPGYQ